MQDRAELVGLYRLRADEVEGSDRANPLMDGDAQEVKRYRLRAEELRTIAATTKDRLSREVLLNVAHDQERRAQAREAIAKWDKKASSRNSA